MTKRSREYVDEASSSGRYLHLVTAPLPEYSGSSFAWRVDSTKARIARMNASKMPTIARMNAQRIPQSPDKQTPR